MACRKNSIDNEQDNIMYFATFVVYLPPKRTNKRKRLRIYTIVVFSFIRTFAPSF